MKKISSGAQREKLNRLLITSLSELGLNGRAILAMTRMAELVRYTPGEQILRQGKKSGFVFFLLEGMTEISILEKGKKRVLGTLSGMTTLGEIAYFNNTPATATVTVAGGKPAEVFRLSYDDFGSVIEEFPDVKETLARIGDMRIIRQYNGFISYRLFMELIGWRRDRFAISRAFVEDLENAVSLSLMPLVKDKAAILEVGDGPGLVSEFLHFIRPELLDQLFLQATHLEEAILSPIHAQPSEFSQAGGLKRKFDLIIAVQVFNVASREGVDAAFEQANRLLKPGGILFAAKSVLLSIRYPGGGGEDTVFGDLEKLVNKAWPGILKSGHLIHTVFIDADLDPEMEWDESLCEKAKQGKLSVSDRFSEEEKHLLSLLIGQAAQQTFDPEKLHFAWLGWKAERHGFAIKKAEQNPEASFFFHILVKG